MKYPTSPKFLEPIESDVDTVDGKLDDVSHAEPTRAKDTIYQNSTKIRFVAISIRLDPDEQAKAYIGSSSPPTTAVVFLVGALSVGDYIYVEASFIVPPNWYYELEETNGTITIAEWHEWDLH